MKNKLLAKTHSILELVAESGKPTKVQDIARSLDLDRSTVGRIVADLCECNYLRRVDCHHVELGLGIIALSEAAMNGTFFPQRAIVVHTAETRKLGIGSALGTIHAGQIIYINRCHNGQIYKSPWRYPLYASNMALVILAELHGVDSAFDILNNSIATAAPKNQDVIRESIKERLEFFSTHGYAIEYAKTNSNLSFPLRHGTNVFGLSFYSEPELNSERIDAFITKGSLIREKIRRLLE